MNGGITELTIRTGSPYPVWVGDGLLRDCGELLARRTAPCTVFLVSDDVVAPLYMERTGGARSVVWVRQGNAAAEAFYRNNQYAPDGWTSTVLIWAQPAQKENKL